MDVREIAEDFAALLRDGRDREAAERHWADDVVSVEAMDGPMAVTRGRAEIFAKHDWWAAHHEVHAVTLRGPFVNGDAFAILFAMEVTPKGGARTAMEEVALYAVRDGRIIEERFYY